MPLSPPASPTTGQTYTANGRTWTWTGTAWELVAASGGGSATLTAATASELGGIKVGSGLAIADGVLSATGDTVLRALFAPGTPTSVTATGGNTQATVSWTAPTGVISQAPITDYIVQGSSNSGSTWTTVSRTASTTASQVVTGLTNGTAYVFRVAAINGVGTGAYTSASSSVTPTAPPSGALSVLRNTNPSNGPHYVAGAGTLASPYFYQRGGELGGEAPVFRVVGTLNITFVFPDTVKIYKGANAVTESIVSFINDPRINTDSRQTLNQAGGTVIASGRNTTVTVSVTDKYLKVLGSDPWIWFPAADNPQGSENIYPSVRVYVS